MFSLLHPMKNTFGGNLFLFLKIRLMFIPGPDTIIMNQKSIYLTVFQPVTYHATIGYHEQKKDLFYFS